MGLAAAAQAQQLDAAFGLSAVKSPSASNASGNYSPQAVGGGAYPAISADVLFKHYFGFQGEVAWRGSQNLYQGYQPYRSIFYDFNAIFAPHFGPRVGAELLAGFGAESNRFYTGQYTCSFTSCTNYTSSNHLMGDVGGGLKLYVTKNIFVRPEVRAYFVRNNFEFSSASAYRAGVSVGYTFRPE